MPVKYKLVVPREELSDILTKQSNLTAKLNDSDVYEEVERQLGTGSADFITEILLKTTDNDIVTHETSGNGVDAPLIEEMGKLYRQRYDIAKEANNEKLMAEAMGAMKALGGVLKLLKKDEPVEV